MTLVRFPLCMSVNLPFGWRSSRSSYGNGLESRHYDPETLGTLGRYRRNSWEKHRRTLAMVPFFP